MHESKPYLHVEWLLLFWYVLMKPASHGSLYVLKQVSHMQHVSYKMVRIYDGSPFI
jgi:hypothetical protein